VAQLLLKRRDEAEPDELEPPPPPPELDELELLLLEDELEADELDEAEELELDAPEELELGGPEELEGTPVEVGDSVPQPPSIPTPASATPPERIRRNSRRSSRPPASVASLRFRSLMSHTFLRTRGGQQATSLAS